MTSGCENCREFAIDQEVLSPAQVEDLGNQLRLAESGGRLVLLGAPDSITPWAMVAGHGRSAFWPDSFSWAFHCPVCRRVFELTVDSYHGSAAWRCVPEDGGVPGTRLTIRSTDEPMTESPAQFPITLELVKQLRSGEFTHYWLAASDTPLRWTVNEVAYDITHVVVSARHVARPVQQGARGLPMNLALVVDSSQVSDDRLEPGKVLPAAIAFCDVG